MKKTNMKMSIMASLILLAPIAFASGAPTKEGLYVRDAKKNFISVAKLIDDEVEFQANYHLTDLCYVGSPWAVAGMMMDYSKKSDYFYSGGGGGFVLVSTKVLSGIAAQFIEMRLADEVVPGEYRKAHVFPCKHRQANP